MFVIAITIIVLLVAILYFVMRPRVVVEAPVIVREVQPVYWMPWAWGWGSGGLSSGSAVVHRPMPHYGPLPRPHH